MQKLLTIGATARLLGLQVDTVRRLERAGRIRAVRTSGGHRRFTPDEIGRYRAAKRKRAAPRLAYRAFARVEAADQPARDPVSGEFIASPPAHPAYTAPAPSQPVRTVPGAAQAASSTVEAYRLHALKMQGTAMIPWGVPAEWHGKVIAELERFVTPIQFPAHLSPYRALEIVRARVAEVLRPYRDAQEKAANEAQLKAQADRRRSTLIAHGSNYAWRETISWDFAAGLEAREEVERVLKRHVTHDLTEREVETFVDEVLDQWEDDDDEDDEE